MYRGSRIILLLLLLSLAVGRVYGQNADQPEPVPWKPSPAGAALRSVLIPGWGQAYNQRPLKAAVYGGLQQGLLIGIYERQRNFKAARYRHDSFEADAYQNDRNRLTWYLAATVLMSALDAYVDAHLFDFDVSDDFAGSSQLQSTATVGNSGFLITFFWRIG